MRLKVSKKIFAHIDCDSFFAACEIFKNPSLKNSYVCVGGEIIVAATYNAKALGIKTGTPVWEAKKMLPKNAVFLSPDMGFYAKISRRLMHFLSQYSLSLEVFSIDEAFAEITGIPESFGMTLDEYAYFLQKRILQEVGVPVSIGVSNTRLRAKIFSKFKKPFGICVALHNEKIYDIFQDISVQKIPFIGKGYVRRLAPNIESVYDFCMRSFGYYQKIIGKNGAQIWCELQGINAMNFAGNKVQKSISKTRSFNAKMTSNKEILWIKLQENIERFFEEMTFREYEFRNIFVFLRNKNFETCTLEYEFESYHCDREKTIRVARELLFRLQKTGEIYRSTGVISTDIQKYSPHQLSIFDAQNTRFEKNIALEKVFFHLHQKYGRDIVNVGTEKGKIKN